MGYSDSLVEVRAADVENSALPSVEDSCEILGRAKREEGDRSEWGQKDEVRYQKLSCSASGTQQERA